MNILYKIVVLLTRNLTKLGLHFSVFSTIFYAFSMLQQNWNYYLRSTLYQGPWNFSIPYIYALDLQNDPGKIKSAAMWPLAMGRRRARRNPAALAEFLAGGNAERKGTSRRPIRDRSFDDNANGECSLKDRLGDQRGGGVNGSR
jgi:hypothetical protein